MKPIISAVFISIILHFLILYTYKLPTLEKSSKKNEIKGKDKVLVRYVQLKKKEKKPSSKNKIIEKKKKKEENKILKKSSVKEYKKVKKIKETKKRTISKTKAKVIKRKPISKEEVLPNFLKQNPTRLQKSLMEDIMKEPLDLRMLDRLTQSYIKLYGQEYNDFTKVQKVFIQNNINLIGRITQKYLRYPRIAIKTRQKGMNIVEFILYPNGDISEPVIINSSRYQALDKNTLKTISIAYKDYPKPKEATKIRIYVTYRLY